MAEKTASRRIVFYLSTYCLVIGMIIPAIAGAAGRAIHLSAAITDIPPRPALYDQTVAPLTMEQCAQCHPGVFGLLKKYGGRHQLECSFCHQSYHAYAPGKTPYADALPSCLRCHAYPHGSASDLVTACSTCHSNGHTPLELPDIAPDKCQNCHTVPAENFRQYPSKHSTLACNECHLSHGLIPQCFDCHTPHLDSQTGKDCLVCHSNPHKPLNITYTVDESQQFCGACHEEVYKKLITSRTLHASLTCARCHPKHGKIPDCRDCHGEPHGSPMMLKYEKCNDCHISAHSLEGRMKRTLSALPRSLLRRKADQGKQSGENRNFSLQAPSPNLPRFSPGGALADFKQPHFVGSGNCALCHDDQVDASENDVAIARSWRSTMMANAARDPAWKAKVSSEIKRNPQLEKIIVEKCHTCHMPMAHSIHAAKNPDDYTPDYGIDNPDTPMQQVANDGVSCSLCHQIRNDRLGSSESFSGNFQVDLINERPNKAIFGPYKEPEQNTMQTALGFIPQYGMHTGTSELCATCHTLYTPFVDSQGTVLGKFPEQVVYFEWQHSAFGDGSADNQSCQNCHMPAASGAVIIAKPAPMDIPAREPFSRHHFVGGNVFMLNMFQDNMDPLALTASSTNIQATVGRTLEQLRTRTAKLQVVSSAKDKEKLLVVVDIINLTGHKLPTGFPSRKVWIHFTVTDKQGKTLFESGRPLESGGIAGDDAMHPGGFEPHYELIDTKDKVQIYNTAMENSDGQITQTLLRAAAYRKDNRLLPKGFDKRNVSHDIAVRGAATTDINFIGGSDRITYLINIAETKDPLFVKAELLYQSLSLEFTQDLFTDETDHITKFKKYFNRADKTPVAIDAVSIQVN